MKVRQHIGHNDDDDDDVVVVDSGGGVKRNDVWAIVHHLWPQLCSTETLLIRTAIIRNVIY